MVRLFLKFYCILSLSSLQGCIILLRPDHVWQDLSKLNRNPGKVIYISGHALESCLQPENCVQIKPWKLEADDTALLDLIPFLECRDFALLLGFDEW